MPDWGALPPEGNSAGFWFGPGSSSFVAAAENLIAVAAGLVANLGGQEAINAALATSWPDPTGELAVLAKVPLMLWQAAAAGQIDAQAAVIHEVALAFESLKAATPTPMEVGENQVEHGVLQANNFLGMLTPAIGVNRANYSRMWVTAASNKYEYAAASMPIQGLPPLPPPPPATASGGATPSMPAPQEKASDLLGGGGDGAMNAFMGPISQVGSMAGQLGQGGPFSSLSQLPQQAMQPFLQMLQGGMGGGNPADALAGATTADWLTATPAAGGPVSANLVGAGGGGGGGFGGGGIGALRGPASFGSTPAINAASSTPESAMSRVNEARLASGAQTSGAGMGSSGAMMGGMGHAAGEQNKEEAKRKSTPLTSLAALYRAPSAVPVITGGGGAVFRPGEGGGDRTT